MSVRDEIERIVRRMSLSPKEREEVLKLVREAEDDEVLFDEVGRWLEERGVEVMGEFVMASIYEDVSDEVSRFVGNVEYRMIFQAVKMEKMKRIRMMHDWDPGQWIEIAEGLDEGLDVDLYAKPEYSVSEMKRIKKELEREKARKEMELERMKKEREQVSGILIRKGV